MIALDTNVLVRYYLTDPDEPRQSEKARRLVDQAISKGRTIYLSPIVLCESVWVLDRCYDISREAQVEFLESVLHDSPFKVSSPEVALKAFKIFRTSHADFADCLVVTEAKAKGCSKT